MSNINRLIDLIVKDRMMVCNCTNDGRKCIKCQYEALKELEPKPSYERVPEGVFVRSRNGNLYYKFGNGQLLAWGLECYCVYRDPNTDAYVSFSPYLIPATFGDLNPGEWFRFQMYYKLKIDDKRMAVGLSDGTVSIGSLWNGCEILRVSEVML